MVNIDDIHDKYEGEIKNLINSIFHQVVGEENPINHDEQRGYIKALRWVMEKMSKES